MSAKRIWRRSCIPPVVAAIESSGRHLLGVIDEVLDLVRVESGDMELTDVDFDLSEVITKCRNSVNGLAQARDVSLSETLPNDGLLVRADHGRMRQVIIALMSNCIALVGSGGKIEVQLSKTAKGEAMILIRSTGSTVSPERMALALEPVDASTISPSPEVTPNVWVSAMACPSPAVWWNYMAAAWKLAGRKWMNPILS